MGNYFDFSDITYRYAIEAKIKKSDFFRHLHTQYEILYIKQGVGTFIIENRAYSFTDNAIIITPPGQYHVLRNAPISTYERIVINFSAELFPDFLPKQQALCKYANSEISALFAKLYGYCERFEKEQVHLLLKSFLIEFLLLLYSNEEQSDLERKEIPPLIKKAVDYITMNIAKPLNIDLIAKQLYVSKSHLNHLFHHTLNIGVMKYVRAKKMGEAQKLLKEGINASQVAIMLGYTNYTTFLRNYREEFNENPIRRK